MGRRSSDTEEESRSRRKKKHRRRSSSSSSSSSRTYSRKKSGRKSRSRSRSRDLQSWSHSYEKRRRHRSSSSSSYGSRRKRSRSRGRGKSYRSQRSRSKSRTRRSRSRARQRSYSRSSERSGHRRTPSGSRERRKGRDKDKGKGKDKETHGTKAGDSANIKAGLEHLTPAEQAKARLQLVLEAAGIAPVPLSGNLKLCCVPSGLSMDLVFKTCCSSRVWTNKPGAPNHQQGLWGHWGQSFSGPSLLTMWNHGWVWVKRDLKAHPVPPQGHLSLSQAAPNPAPAWPWALPGIQGQPQLLWNSLSVSLSKFLLGS
ncbi:serine/Arginine-related protein 53 isoform 2-T5 [Sylvia borin]